MSQLRFAATVQDIRTVVLLRRQLRAESVRARPWFADRRSGGHGNGSPVAVSTTPGRPARRSMRPRRGEAAGSLGVPWFVWRRGLVSIARLPASRLLRIAGLAAVAGVSASLVVSESPLLAIPMVGAAFLVGLESVEPLAQEIDRPDLTDSLPVDRGPLFAHHLVAPALLLAVAGLVGASTATIVEPGHAAVAFALGVPLAWAGAMGSVVATVTDAPDPPSIAGVTITGADRGAESPFSMPEFAGFRQVGTGALPVVLSSVCALPVVALRYEPGAATVLRSLVGVALCLAVMVWWVVRRDRWSSSIRSFFAAGRAA